MKASEVASEVPPFLSTCPSLHKRHFYFLKAHLASWCSAIHFSWKRIRGGEISLFLQKCSWSGFPLKPIDSQSLRTSGKRDVLDISSMQSSSLASPINSQPGMEPSSWWLCDRRHEIHDPVLKRRRHAGITGPFENVISSTSPDSQLKGTHLTQAYLQAICHWVPVTQSGLRVTAALAHMCLW